MILKPIYSEINPWLLARWLFASRATLLSPYLGSYSYVEFPLRVNDVTKTMSPLSTAIDAQLPAEPSITWVQ